MAPAWPWIPHTLTLRRKHPQCCWAYRHLPRWFCSEDARAVNRSMRHTRLVAVAWWWLSCLPLAGQVPSGRPRGVVSPELLRFLQLTPEQGASINRLSADWNTSLQGYTARANEIRRAGVNHGADAAALKSICGEVTAHRYD